LTREQQIYQKKIVENTTALNEFQTSKNDEMIALQNARDAFRKEMQAQIDQQAL
jgi:hypothetical protein